MTHSATPSQTDWQFSGFAFPTTTAVPDQVFDELLHRLSGAELKVLLYIIRRTFGFKKNRDDISLSQMVRGIRKQDGVVLDRGTGLSKASVARALNSLAQKRVIVRQRRQSHKKGDEATTYTLNIVGHPPVSQNETPPVSKRDTPVSHQRDTQQTELQQTVRQQQKQAKGVTSSGGADKQNLAAVLIDKGIGERVARQFATKYDRQRIEDNIDWFEWKLKTDPTSIKSNPAGLLRCAIEQNYAAEGHHRGFQTRRQKARAVVAKKQRLAAQQRLVDEREQQQRTSLQQKETKRIKRLETLREHYHTTPQMQATWTAVLNVLKSQMTEARFNAYLAQSAILSLNNDTAVIAVPNRFIKSWLEDHVSETIEQTLADQLNGQPMILQYVALDASESEHKMSTTGSNKSPPSES